MNKTFLIEIETEELPPKSLKTIAQSFEKQMIEKSKKYNLKYEKTKWFATPKRIAIMIFNININTKCKNIQKKGPSISNAFDKFGKPTQIMKFWMKKLNIKINQTTRLKTEKGEWVAHTIIVKNLPIKKIITKICLSAIENISIPIFMRWNSNNVQFSRPIRNIIMLLDKNIIHNTILGLKTNRLLSGHTFMTSKKIKLNHANQYSQILLELGKVIADYNVRKNKIKKESEDAAKSINGFLKINNELLEEITALVEWPKILIASFEKKFLNLPHEILIHILEKKQRCFPIYNINKNTLSNFFIIISNIETSCSNNIIHGNEKVIHAQFSDAEFFFNKDIKIKLQNYQPLLKKVIFHDSLGSMFEKTNRIKKLITWISTFTHANLNDCIQAANLSKCDLVTDMIFEFPEYQGIIGMYYALHNLESKNIATAIKEQYQPRFSKDKLPSHPVSYSLALSDKVDTLVGLFSTNKNHNINEKDPFALRRLAIGIIRIIIKKNIQIDLHNLFEKSLQIYKLKNDIQQSPEKIVQFLIDKIHSIYSSKKYNSLIIKSILANNNNLKKLTDLNHKINAITYIFNNHANILHTIISTYKRVSNILKKNNVILFQNINITLLKETEEINLVKKLKTIQKYNNNYPLSKQKYVSILLQFDPLCELIHNFFKNTKINHDDIDIKTNRLTLLQEIKNLFLTISNFTYFSPNLFKK